MDLCVLIVFDAGIGTGDNRGDQGESGSPTVWKD
jgi:hypothetical protein